MAYLLTDPLNVREEPPPSDPVKDGASWTLLPLHLDFLIQQALIYIHECTQHAPV
jgi:hypothetical protein